jgi:hypothetical protein
MKSSKSIAAIIAASLFIVSLAFSAEPKKDAAPANKVAGCCAKAKTAGKACDHGCCVTAAKEGNNCTKCGGAGKVEVKK